MVSFFCHTSPPMMHCTDTGQQVMGLLWAENSKTISKFFFFFLITNCFRYCITVMKKDILQPAYHSFLTPTKYIFSYSVYQILLSDTSKYCSLYQDYSSSFLSLSITFSLFTSEPSPKTNLKLFIYFCCDNVSRKKKKAYWKSILVWPLRGYRPSP